MNDAAAWHFAASTLGVVTEDLPSTIGTMCRHGVTAAELRSADGAFIHPGLSVTERERVREIFTDSGIEIFSVASGVLVAAVGDDGEVAARLEAELQLAADLGARYVRVFPGAPTHGLTPSDALPILVEESIVADTRAVGRLVRVMDMAAELGVSPVIETHDSHPGGAEVSRLLDVLGMVAPDHCVGAIWDVLHPWRIGEDLTLTAELLLEHVLNGRGYVQIKDVTRPSDTYPVLPGRGAIPLAGFLALLDNAGYRGPVSLEWERFWRRSAAPLDAALEAAATVLRSNPPLMD